MNKIVRDKIPDIIKEFGKIPITSILSDKEAKTLLIVKLLEESKEALASKSNGELVAELVDLQEVIDRLLQLCKISDKDFKERQKAKREYKGGFQNNIFLEKIE